MITLLFLPIVAFVFYYIGKYQERLDWNELIKMGVIPRPKNK